MCLRNREHCSEDLSGAEGAAAAADATAAATTPADAFARWKMLGTICFSLGYQNGTGQQWVKCAFRATTRKE